MRVRTCGMVAVAVTALLGPLLPGPPAHAGSGRTAPLSRRIETLVKAYATEDMFSGAVLVAKGGRIVYSGAFGEANKDHHVANRLDTRFNIGSIGKTVTAVCIMQLVDAGKLQLTDPVGRFLPECPFPEKDTITVQHLLTHSSGLGDYFEHPDYGARKDTLRTISDILPLVYDRRPDFPAGTQYRYSNSGFLVLGAIVEKVGGMPYQEYVRMNVFEPLGMNESALAREDEVLPNRSVGYTKNAAGGYLANVLVIPPPCSAGGLHTTVGDLLKFDQALYGTKLLSEEGRKTMFAPSALRPATTHGWEAHEIDGHEYLGHSGGADGIEAYFLRFTGSGHTVIVLSNYDGGAGSVTRDIAAILFDEPVVLPTAMDANFALAYRLRSKEALAEAVSVFARNLRGDRPHRLSLFMSAQCRIRGALDLKQAVAELDRYIQTDGTDLRPPEARRDIERIDPPLGSAWRSKGAALRKLGQTDEAIRCYAKALELDPKDDRARQALDELRTQEDRP